MGPANHGAFFCLGIFKKSHFDRAVGEMSLGAKEKSSA
jgi:hypothetical protein